MNPNHTDAYKYLAQAQQARKAGDKRLARQYAEQAARLAPELEDVWLMMAALASPRASVVFMEQALQINPDSERVRQGMHWAVERLKNEPTQKVIVARPAPAVQPEPETKPIKPTGIPLMMILLAMMCLVMLTLTVLTGPSIVRAATSMMSSQNTPGSAPANIAKATPANSAGETPVTVAPAETDIPAATEILPVAATETRVDDVPTAADTPLPTDTEIPQVADTPTPFPTAAPTATQPEVPTPTPLATDDPTFATPTALPTDTAMPLPTQYVAPTAKPGGNTTGNNSGRWIDVDLTNQAVYAYEGNTVVNSFIVSTGTWQHPTVTGQYHVYIKYLYKDMTGPGYYLPNVPYTMFFYQGYAIHGTYWHSNFGTPMSHGCVNLSIPDSEWIYNWASVGTLVNVHY